MSRNLDLEILAKRVSCDSHNQLTRNIQPLGYPSPSDIDAQSPEAKSRAVTLVEERDSYPEDNKLDDNSSACLTVSRSSKAAKNNSQARNMSNQVCTRTENIRHSIGPYIYYPTSTYHTQLSEIKDQVSEPQQPDHPVSKTEVQQAIAQAIHSMPARTTTKAVPVPEHATTHGISDVVVSLRGGGLDSDWPQPKKHQPETRRPIQGLLLTRPSPPVGDDDGPQDDDDGAMPASTPPRFPGSVTTTKRKATYFDPPFTSFRALPTEVKLSTLSYLRGEPVMEWARNLGLPLMDMFWYFRCCVLLLCEDENSGLSAVLHDPVAYARFRDGLNPNFLAPDDDFVQSVRAQNRCLDVRLQDPYQRLRLVFAFRTVDFPAIMEEGKDEEVVSGGGNASEGTERDEGGIGVYSGLGDLDMST
ncbi:hypothetical protein F4859DRAFT_493142 [Xylaria cf. heliscus]|nr:hypothetical protein F4859DRAFT_493142 [Xylaria cf. heliscus]